MCQHRLQRSQIVGLLRRMVFNGLMAFTVQGPIHILQVSGADPGFLSGGTGAEGMASEDGVSPTHWGGDWSGGNAPSPEFLKPFD